MTKLKPCPFCGGSDLSIFNVYDDNGVTVLCDKCNGGVWCGIEELPNFDDGAADYELSVNTEGLEPLFNKWNRRAYIPNTAFDDNCACSVKPCYHADIKK